MKFVEALVLVALFLGVAIGMWFERGRLDGSEHMRRQRDSARRACDAARAERDQLRARLRTHPAAAPSERPTRALHLVERTGPA